MLKEIGIQNFVFIESQNVQFGDGLNVISGESGSGKSVLLSALEFVLGARLGPQVIRAGAESAEVQLLLDLSEVPQSLLKHLPDELKDSPEKELLLSRSINSSGKNRAYINGKTATVSSLESIGATLVAISTQREHLKLLNPAYHRDLIDAFAKNDSLIQKYSVDFSAWSSLKEKISALEEKLSRSAMRRFELETIQEDLSKLRLGAGVREELETRVRRLQGSGQLRSLGQEMLEALNGESGALDSLRLVLSHGHEFGKIDARAQAIIELFATARTEIQEGAADLKAFLQSIDINENELSAARDELATIAKFERKYRTTDEGLANLLVQAKEELSILDEPDAIETLKKELLAKRELLSKSADQLTESRIKAAKGLGKEIGKEIKELGLEGARLSVKFEKVGFALHGQDSAEILISPAKDADFGALRQIASGGEVSRIFLAFRKVLGGRHPVAVFDEVDSGVSGRIARAVGEKLRAVSKGAQVLCVTHLPQVASLADHHFTVSKVNASKNGNKRTLSVIKEVLGDEKVEEIARMLSGYDVTSASRESARELLSSKV